MAVTIKSAWKMPGKLWFNRSNNEVCPEPVTTIGVRTSLCETVLCRNFAVHLDVRLQSRKWNGRKMDGFAWQMEPILPRLRWKKAHCLSKNFRKFLRLMIWRRRIGNLLCPRIMPQRFADVTARKGYVRIRGQESRTSLNKVSILAENWQVYMRG